MGFNHKITWGVDGIATVVAVDLEGRARQMVNTADSRHPHWTAILDGLEAEDNGVWELFDVAGGVINRLRKITDRVSYDGENILWDGDKVHTVLADQIRRALEAGESNYEALAKFWEKLESNPNEHSKAQAYTWLATHDFKITEDGDVVGYKGVVADSYGVGGFKSIHSGTAYVDGEKVVGQIPNPIGAEVTMPRAEVKHNPNVHCHQGLHVGDWSYASSFARGAVLEVHVNPRDIVSVPNDHGYRKVRVCKYKVVNVVTSEYDGGPVLRPEGVNDHWSRTDVGYIAR